MFPINIKHNIFDDRLEPPVILMVIVARCKTMLVMGVATAQ